MLVESDKGVSIVCDKCGSQMQIATHPMQMSAKRLPSGWMRTDGTTHSCPLCSRALVGTFRAR